MNLKFSDWGNKRRLRKKKGDKYKVKALIILILDINECNTGKHHCGDGICQNTDGSYSCICPEGYTIIDSGKRCIGLKTCF